MEQTLLQKVQEGVEYIVENWDKIPQTFNENILDHDKSKVIILLSRQKPSVRRDWDFDEERITVDKNGRIIWGFDSGCSCPTPWHDNAPGCYSCSKNWKEFETELDSFDSGALDECLETIDRIKKSI